MSLDWPLNELQAPSNVPRLVLKNCNLLAISLEWYLNEFQAPRNVPSLVFKQIVDSYKCP